LARFVCRVCGYIYDEKLGDPEGGVQPDTPFEAIPEDWVCLVCGASKADFDEMGK